MLVTAWPIAALGQSEVPATDSGQGQPGGALSVDVPQGAVAPGTTISVAGRDPAERPEELEALSMEMTFHELQPMDVRFRGPVTVTRSIAFQEVGRDRFDPLFDGLLAGSLITRDAEGTWSWLDGIEVRLARGEDAFVVTGTTDHGGPIIAYVAGDVIVATEDASTTPVGGVFRVEGQLRVDPASQADIASVSGRTSDGSIAKAGRSYDVESFDRAEGLEFECLTPGTVEYEATFSIGGIADVSPLNGAIGLSGTDVAVTHTGEHACG
jgi:hypothetical protein